MQLLDLNHGWQALARLGERLERFNREGLPRAHQNAGQAVRNWIESNFAQAGNLTPTGWPKAQDETAVNGRLLQKSGRLHQNWHIADIGDGVCVKAGANYALAHHQGTDVLPVRPLVPEGQTLADLVLPVYAKAITDNLP